MGQRGFLPVKEEKKWVNWNCDKPVFYIPKRSTKYSAGYEFRSTHSFKIHPGKMVKVYTNIKAYMLNDEYLDINIRSSIAMRKDLRLKNCVGVVDADFFENIQNDGNIIIGLLNEGTEEQEIGKGERIAQGIFKKYLITDDDNVTTKRIGGTGSTGK